MMRTLLVRGMFAGVAAGVLMWAFAQLFAETAIDQAIGFEEHMAEHAGEPAGAELVSRGVQSTLGLAGAVLVYGVAIGGIFALAFATVHGRIGRTGPRGTAAVLGLVGYLVVFVVPFVKYPANPPAASASETISQRTALYLVMVIASVGLAVVAVWGGRRLVARMGAWNGGLAAALGYLVAVAVVMLVLPTVNETPAEFPATVLYQFRIASLGNQAVLWATLGLLFGWLAERALTESAGYRRLEASSR
jgi:predicted cobalt transporter CbtA